MAAKKSVAKKGAKQRPVKGEAGTPAFPYTTEPGALRRLLKEIPNRPKPPKMTRETLKSWNVSSSNNSGSVISVLKKVGLLNDVGAPTDEYAEFMKASSGPAVLGAKVRETYRVLFENSNAPQSESPGNLKSLFNIHTGGGEDAMRYQMQTFKILTEFSNFTDVPLAGSRTDSQAGSGGGSDEQGRHVASHLMPPVQIDLHIHLPENKSTRDYEAIIQDIAKYIYGREIDRA